MIDNFIDETLRLEILKIANDKEQETLNFGLDLCYVASKYKGDYELNTKYAKTHCNFVARTFKMIPIAPHLIFPAYGFKDEVEHDRKVTRIYGLKLLALCKRAIFFIDKNDEDMSEGMKAEFDFAMKLPHIEIENILYTLDHNKEIVSYETNNQMTLIKTSKIEVEDVK